MAKKRIKPAQSKKSEKPATTRIEAVPEKSRYQKIVAPIVRTVDRRKNLRPDSPHQSFRRTYQRDYVRSLNIPGYIPFTFSVLTTLRQHKLIFLKLTISYAVLSMILVGLASQDTYSQLSELLRSTSGDIFEGNIGRIGEAGVLLGAGLAGGLNPNLSEVQQLLGGLLVLFAWLATVWLLRAFLAGQSPKLRDALYNSGAPIIPTILLGLLLLVQLMPAAVATIGISAALPTGLISNGVEGMIFWATALLLFLLSLYWTTSTIMAMIIVTLPGMYPLRALKSAHELVVGRRQKVVLRVVWLFVITALAWLIILLPIIILDAWLKGLVPQIDWLPIVPVSLLIVSSASVIWVASYIYLFYRKVVDDDSAPA